MSEKANKFEFVTLDEFQSEHIAAPRYSYWRSVFRKFFSSKLTIVMLIIAVTILLLSYVHPLISGYDGSLPYINQKWRWFQKPSLEFPFGTDNHGNSLFDAVWFGARSSLTVSLAATAITTVVGTIVGMIWGFSKKIDKFMLELYNIVSNVPFMLLVMILVYVLGNGIWQLVFAMSCTSWIGMAYFIRVQVMIIRDREYNLASQCLGTPLRSVLLHNVLPYLTSIIVTDVARTVPSYISYEVFLSFIGIGLSVKDASLGYLIQNYTMYMSSVPYLFWIPVAISALISISLYIVGQSLADATDPRTHMM